MHGTEVIVAIHKDLNSVTRLSGSTVPPRDEFVRFVYDTFAVHWQVFQGYPYDRLHVKVLSPTSNIKWISATAVGFIIVTNSNLTNIPWFTTCAPPCSSNYKQFVTHEMFHAWNGNTIESEFSRISYIQPEYWFHEGATQYYGFRGTPDDLGLYERRFRTSWQRYQGWRGSKYDVPLIRTSEMEVTTGDSEYGQVMRDKGACMFYLLDSELMTAGKSMDDLMRFMYETYGLTSKRYTSKDVFLGLNAITGRDWTNFFDKYVYGTEPLPLDGKFEYLKHCHNSCSLSSERKVEQHYQKCTNGEHTQGKHCGRGRSDVPTIAMTPATSPCCSVIRHSPSMKNGGDISNEHSS